MNIIPDNQLSSPPPKRKLAGFTLIEIAISLAIIGFALVAIIGILPAGMSVQRENREETIINQDATVFLNAIRNAERGVDDLTNYVVGITNHSTEYVDNVAGATRTTWYTVDTSSTSPVYPLTNGLRILGLLTTPRIWSIPGPQANRFRSNYVTATFRSISGPASEKSPQRNPAVQELALTYRLLPAILPYTNYFEPAWTNYNDPALYTPSTNLLEIARREQLFRITRQNEANLHDIRLTFRWPLTQTGVGNGRQVFRTSLTAPLDFQIEPGYPTNSDFALFFFNPRNYAKAVQ